MTFAVTDQEVRLVLRGKVSHVKKIWMVGAAISITSFANPVPDDPLTARLDSVAFTNETRRLVSGVGGVVATISDGGVVTLVGNYGGLASPATSIVVLKGPRTGVPGQERLAAFPVAQPSTRGSFSERIRMSKSNLAALLAGQIYLQIVTETAPDGAIWGWIIRKSDTFGERVPDEQ